MYCCLNVDVDLDLDSNLLVLRRLGDAKEILHDLKSGHVAVQLIKSGVNPPQISQATMDACIDGAEVAVDEVAVVVVLGPSAWSWLQVPGPVSIAP